MKYSIPRRSRLAFQRQDSMGRWTNERDDLVYHYILTYTVKHMGHTPTLRQICDYLGSNSTSAMRSIIQRLILKGKLQRVDGVLVLPGSRFSWQPPYPGDPGAIPSAHRAIEYPDNAAAWF